ncbi:MAG: putative DNA binding domain-containing protein, partial [Gemmatimonadota bacterium]|nr:putative DNA binding domain-containing protein [Gemmatimonadota bacterium]
MNDTRTLALIDDLLAASAETSCVEFKENNFAPPVIGKYISALANAAALAEQNFAYLLWGVRDSDRAITGTHFEPDTVKRHGQPLAFWLAQRLSPDVAFTFQIVAHPEGRLVLLEIPSATTSPVEFERTAYIRIGSATPRLSDYPDRQKTLWGKLQPYLWESGVAAQFLTDDAVLARIDYASYFALMDQPLMANPQAILERLHQDQIIALDVGGRWNITNLGAILFANHLDEFDSRIARKAVRFTAYNGMGRADTVTHRYDEPRGYAVGFARIVDYIDRLLPRNEQIDQVFRIEQPLFPPIALRELIANALIHQDMTITGAGPSIELFSNRLEITNPGK